MISGIKGISGSLETIIGIQVQLCRKDNPRHWVEKAWFESAMVFINIK
jgi:hypothetical protein